MKQESHTSYHLSAVRRRQGAQKLGGRSGRPSHVSQDLVVLREHHPDYPRPVFKSVRARSMDMCSRVYLAAVKQGSDVKWKIHCPPFVDTHRASLPAVPAVRSDICHRGGNFDLTVKSSSMAGRHRLFRTLASSQTFDKFSKRPWVFAASSSEGSGRRIYFAMAMVYRYSI